jgi:hypothetical protein
VSETVSDLRQHRRHNVILSSTLSWRGILWSPVQQPSRIDARHAHASALIKAKGLSALPGNLRCPRHLQEPAHVHGKLGAVRSRSVVVERQVNALEHESARLIEGDGGGVGVLRFGGDAARPETVFKD